MDIVRTEEATSSLRITYLYDSCHFRLYEKGSYKVISMKDSVQCLQYFVIIFMNVKALKLAIYKLYAYYWTENEKIQKK